ncbi:MAG: undecaprenyl-diphosphatase UppP [Patescibacteria group bacterium]
MDYILSLVFGIVQGITEFFPVSSSGHLILLHELTHFNLSDNLAFDVALHFGTFLALVLFFYKDLIKLLSAWLKSFSNWQVKSDFDQRLAWLILVAIIPAGIAGYFFESQIESLFYQPWIIALMLIVVGILFLIVERLNLTQHDLKNLTWKQSLLIGLSQILAFIPGTSRSGITIIAGMSTKLNREQATRFSFLMSTPLIFGASLSKGLDLVKISLSQKEILIFMIGLISSTVVGYLAIKYLLKFVSKYRLDFFAYYRFALAGIIIIYLLII